MEMVDIHIRPFCFGAWLGLSFLGLSFFCLLPSLPPRPLFLLLVPACLWPSSCSCSLLGPAAAEWADDDGTEPFWAAQQHGSLVILRHRNDCVWPIAEASGCAGGCPKPPKANGGRLQHVELQRPATEQIKDEMYSPPFSSNCHRQSQHHLAGLAYVCCCCGEQATADICW